MSFFSFGLIIASFSVVGICADQSNMLTMLARMGRRVNLHSLRIDAGIGSRSQDFLQIFFPELVY